MVSIQQHTLQSKHGRPFVADVYSPTNTSPKSIIVFSHGFKGFKDWGCFPFIARTFARQGFAFVLFNFSHNGTTVDRQDEFADLEAFGNNNFSKELDDLSVVIDFVSQHFHHLALPIMLIGHSRGGGISILKAREDERISALSVWGSVSQFGKFWKNNEMEIMKRDGVIFIPNARTNQQMPVYKQLYEDYEANLSRLHIPQALENLQQPLLIVHGTKDETVPVQSAYDIQAYCTHASLLLIPDGNHTFGAKHPHHGDALPRDTTLAVEATIQFFSKLV